MKIKIMLLCVLSMATLAYAQEGQEEKKAEGNKGYLYGSAKPPAPAEEAQATEGRAPHKLPSVVDGIKKIDAWVEKNLW